MNINNTYYLEDTDDYEKRKQTLKKKIRQQEVDIFIVEEINLDEIDLLIRMSICGFSGLVTLNVQDEKSLREILTPIFGEHYQKEDVKFYKI